MFDMYRSGLIQCTEILLSNAPRWYRRKLCTKVVIICRVVWLESEVGLESDSSPVS